MEEIVPPAESAPPEAQAEGSRRRGAGSKRKGQSGSSSSKRLAKERNLSSFHPYNHNGPVTRARQSPNKFTVSVAVPQGLAEKSTAEASADAAGREDNGGHGERMVGEYEELDLMVVDPDFDAIRTRERDVHVVPTHAGWFSWGKIHHVEKQSLESFFNGKSESRTAEIYLKIRNSIMEKFHRDPQTHIELEHLNELDVGEMDARQEVMEFLDHWGLINFHPFPPDASNPSASKSIVSDKAESLSETLYQFGVSCPLEQFTRNKLDTSSSAVMPQRLFSESTVFDDLIRPEGPSVEYHCNSCSADCSRKRYHCQKQADFDLCMECFNNEKFGSGMTSADFILMEPAEAPGMGGGSWSDQETLLLLEALELYGENWNEIAEHVATKTKTQCILHFVQMPIEDRFFVEDTDTDEKITSDKDENVPEKEKEECKIEHVDEDEVLRAMRTAFMASGSGLKEEEVSSFADAANPVMALVAFMVALVDHDFALTSSRSSLRAMTEESPGIHLAARHCYVLEDPPMLQRVEHNCEIERTQKGEEEKVNDEKSTHSSEDCDQNQISRKENVKDSDGSSLSMVKVAYNTDDCSNDFNNNHECDSNTRMESSKVTAESMDETKSKADDLPEVSKSSSKLPAEEKEYLNGITSDSTAVTAEPEGRDVLKAELNNDERDSRSSKTEDETLVAKIKKAAISALSAAAVTAKLLVYQEEDQIRHLATLIIEKQLKKLDIKLGLFGEVESVISKARELLDRARQRLIYERAQIITTRLGLPPASRPMPPSLPVAKLSMAQNSTSSRPPMSVAHQRFPFK